MEFGIDTWRLARYLDRDRDLEHALSRCSMPVRGGALCPERVRGHVVGVATAHRMLFVEGHPAVEGLAPPTTLQRAEEQLLAALADQGWPLGRDGGCGRLDQTVTLRFDRPAEGRALLAGLAVLDVPRVKPGIIGRPPETVYWLGQKSGRKLARAYDKGLEANSAPPGTLIRLENQTRYVKEARRAVKELDPGHVGRRFERRFAPVAESAEGLRAATLPVLAEHLGDMVRDGKLTGRQAERLAGYLLVHGAGLPKRTRMRRRRELRDQGLVLADALNDPVEVDLGEALDAALAAWSSSSLDLHEGIDHAGA